MTTDVAKAPTEREVLVMTLGAAGRGRAEIALALGVSLPLLEVEAAEDTRLDALLRAADGLALAWWETQTREACEAGRFDLAGWGREMQRRFGETPAGRMARPAAEEPPGGAGGAAGDDDLPAALQREGQAEPRRHLPVRRVPREAVAARRAQGLAARRASRTRRAPAPDEIDAAAPDGDDEEINDEQL